MHIIPRVIRCKHQACSGALGHCSYLGELGHDVLLLRRCQRVLVATLRLAVRIAGQEVFIVLVDSLRAHTPTPRQRKHVQGHIGGQRPSPARTFSINWELDSLKNWLKVLCILSEAARVSELSRSRSSCRFLVLVITSVENCCSADRSCQHSHQHTGIDH